MSMNEYNKHSLLGPLAGRPTSLSGVAGQEAYRRNAEMSETITGSNEPFRYKDALRALICLIVVGTISFLATFLLPESMQAIPGFIAMACAFGVVIVTVYAGIETAKIAGMGVVRLVFRQGWWIVPAAAISALVFAEAYIYAIAPAQPWMLAAFAAVLAVTSKCIRASRPVCAALTAGIVTYVLAVGSFSNLSLILAALLGLTVSAAVLAAVRLLRRSKPTAS